MARPGIVIVDATHWLDEYGDLPYGESSALFRQAVRMAQCIEYGAPAPRQHAVHTMIECRRRPDHTPCRGLLMVLKTERDELYVFCPTCKAEEFLISNWQDTMWAEGIPEPFPVELDPFARDDEGDGAPDDTPDADPLNLVQPDGTLNLANLRSFIATADHPGAVVQRVVAAMAPRSEAEVQQIAGTVMGLWNTVPRPELGGRSPEQMHQASRPAPARTTKVGRNQPCPCGSGKKHKRCCGAH